MKAALANKLCELFGIDRRSLAALRIGLALMLLLDLVNRAGHLTAFFTDDGLLSRTTWLELYPRHDAGFAHNWSLHLASGEAWFQWLLFATAVVFAGMLLIGYRTFLATFGSWALLLSAHHRALVIYDGGDALLQCLMFWCLFVPLGAAWSVDLRLRPPPGEAPRRIVSAGTAALLLQLCMMYWTAAALKYHPRWISEGTAVYYALSIDAFATPLGRGLLEYPQLLRWLTWTTWWLQCVGPILAFCPLWTGRVRMLLVLLFWAFHLSLAATISLGLFPWIAMVAWLAFVPTGAWDVSERVLGVALARVGSWVDRLSAGHGRWRLFAHPASPRWRLGWLGNLVAAVLLVYVALWNLREVNYEFWRRVALPQQANIVGRVTGLNQLWNLFAPYPRVEDGWYVMQGTLQDGSKVNLWEPGRPLPWDKPLRVNETYRDQRWRKYLFLLKHDTYAPYRRDLAGWLARQWNARPEAAEFGKQVDYVEIDFMSEPTPPPGQALPPPEREMLWSGRAD